MHMADYMTCHQRQSQVGVLFDCHLLHHGDRMEGMRGKSYALSPSVHREGHPLTLTPRAPSIFQPVQSPPGFLERGTFSAQVIPFVPSGHYHTVLTSLDSLEVGLWVNERGKKATLKWKWYHEYNISKVLKVAKLISQGIRKPVLNKYLLNKCMDRGRHA